MWERGTSSTSTTTAKSDSPKEFQLVFDYDLIEEYLNFPLIPVKKVRILWTNRSKRIDADKIVSLLSKTKSESLDIILSFSTEKEFFPYYSTFPEIPTKKYKFCHQKIGEKTFVNLVVAVEVDEKRIAEWKFINKDEKDHRLKFFKKDIQKLETKFGEIIEKGFPAGETIEVHLPLCLLCIGVRSVINYFLIKLSNYSIHLPNIIQEKVVKAWDTEKFNESLRNRVQKGTLELSIRNLEDFNNIFKNIKNEFKAPLKFSEVLVLKMTLDFPMMTSNSEYTKNEINLTFLKCFPNLEIFQVWSKNHCTLNLKLDEDDKGQTNPFVINLEDGKENEKKVCPKLQELKIYFSLDLYDVIKFFPKLEKLTLLFDDFNEKYFVFEKFLKIEKCFNYYYLNFDNCYGMN